MENEAPRVLPYRELAAKPVWSMLDLAALMDVPFSTLEQAIEDCPPRLFTVGRRRYIKPADAMVWIDQLATRYPYTRKTDGRTTRKARYSTKVMSAEVAA